MAISIFPSTAAEFVSNNFVVDMNDSTNNTADTGGVKQAGPYSMSFSSGDTSFDVYLIDDEGNSVGYSNSTSINASGLFTTVVILGVAQDEIISFTYQGSVNNADGEGDEPGAGAYLESISPSDLPSIDDTATVIGGNFGADTEITFESGATVLGAKSITVVSGTELLVTRPDSLIEDDSPYTVRAVTTGVPEPTGTNANLLVNEVTAGSDPTWVTTSPLNLATVGSSFTQTLEATDAEGTVTDYSVTSGTITPGLTLNASTGVLSGTATTAGNFTFTVTATDDGGNTTDREFEQLAGTGISGGTEVTSGGFDYYTFTSSDDLNVFEETTVEYLVIAGGGGCAGQTNRNDGLGGGGAGGLLSGTATLSPGARAITIGAGGVGADGSDSALATVVTAIGGGKGGADGAGGNGGSGGGGRGFQAASGGTGTAGQGNDGGDGDGGGGGGGGCGAGSAGSNAGSSNAGNGGLGSTAFSTWATATLTGDNGAYASGGGGGADLGESAGSASDGGGGNGGGNGQDALANTGGGGGGTGGTGFENTRTGGDGGSGIVIVRVAV